VPNDQPKTYHLFEAVGIEVETMIVDQETLEVRPLTPELLRDKNGQVMNEMVRGSLGWSNELASHVIEFKTLAPVVNLNGLVSSLAEGMNAANRRLEQWNARLLPTAMHPFMEPQKEMSLWSHGDTSVYQAFDRIFGCRGHGFANLQSVHINLPFSGDEEFARLHAAVRLVLPIIPCLAASSPFQEGRLTGWSDTRLEVYRHNQKAVPEVAGSVIPERVFSRHAYETQILAKIYAAIAPHDPEGILQKEWLNSRGAIARFDRHALEIRLVDTQECPQADMAVAALIVALCKALTEGRFEDFPMQKLWDEKDLETVFLAALQGGGKSRIVNEAYLKALGEGERAVDGRTLWRRLYEKLAPADPTLAAFAEAYDVLFSQGTLSERLVRKIPRDPSRQELKVLYRDLAQCLARNQMFG
jgi:gamma-glutamyl:cysteine ligase YbdK (ATP-grasp superfamily)